MLYKLWRISKPGAVHFLRVGVVDPDVGRRFGFQNAPSSLFASQVRLKSGKLVPLPLWLEEHVQGFHVVFKDTSPAVNTWGWRREAVWVPPPRIRKESTIDDSRMPPALLFVEE